MNIVIHSPTRIELDGQDAGMVLDVFLAREDLRPQIREAMVAWHARHVREDAERQATADKRVTDIKAECEAKVRALEADMAVLGTKEEAREMGKAQRRKALEAELAALDGKQVR